MKKIKILNATKDPSIIKDVRETLEGEKDFELIKETAKAENLSSHLAKQKPNVVLFDFATLPDPFNLLEKMVAEHSNIAFVVVLLEKDDADQERIFRLGAQEIIRFPFESGELTSIISRAAENLSHDIKSDKNAADSGPTAFFGHTVTVFSPKGGIGTSTVATNLAVALQKALKQDVLIIDGKHQFGHVALYFNIRTGNSIADLIAHANELDEQLIRQVVIKHASGVHVLPSPLSVVEAQGIKPKELFDVLQFLQKLFPIIVIDGGNTLNENTVTYMDSSDRVLLVLSSDIASMRDARQFMEVAASLTYPKEKILLLLNLIGKKAAVKKEEIERILKMQIFGRIPSDENAILSSLNEGVPLQISKPRHPIGRAINDISKDLLKEFEAIGMKLE